MRLLSLIVLLFCVGVSQGQFGFQQPKKTNRQRPMPTRTSVRQQHQQQPPKTSPKGGQPKGRILEGPEPNLCANRAIHEVFNNKGYWFSWKDSDNSRERDWLDGRNFCRKRCMDLVSLETSIENEFIKSKIVEDNQKYIWTSGRLCDFKGCDAREDLKPIAVNGWFWSGELKKLAPTTDRMQNDWSPSGGIKKPQPDNREFIQQKGGMENCLAILNNFYGDGVHWHDVACHHRKPIVCEDSQALLNYVRATNPSLRL